VLEKAVHDEHSQEVGNNQPCRPPGRGPKIEQLVEEKNQHEEDDGKPFVAQRSRPVEAGLEEASRGLAHQHEGASQAEKIPRSQQNQHQHPAKVKPAEGGRQILRSQSWPQQAMQDHYDADDEQGSLEQWAGITPAEQMAQARDPH
jgi:hypothetical protein